MKVETTRIVGTRITNLWISVDATYVSIQSVSVCRFPPGYRPADIQAITYDFVDADETPSKAPVSPKPRGRPRKAVEAAPGAPDAHPEGPTTSPTQSHYLGGGMSAEDAKKEFEQRTKGAR